MTKISFTDLTLLLPMLTWLSLGSASGIPATAVSEQDNEAPKVSIITPGEDGKYRLNTRVPYKVSVSDREDGESKYDEIATGEVLLELRYFPAEESKDAKVTESPLTNSGLQGIASSNCLYCHAFRGNLIGPSFQEIGLKYQQAGQKMEEIAMRILNGSTGVWGDKVMPSHPELSRDEVDHMLNWISEYATREDLRFQNGLDGTLDLQANSSPGQGGGTFILTAAYRDHGTGTAPKKTGTDRVVLYITQ